MPLFKKKPDTSELIFDYAILLGGLIVSGLLIRALNLSQQYILLATIPLSLGYVGWGMIHHRRHCHIDRKIVMEYLGLSLLINLIIAILVL